MHYLIVTSIIAIIVLASVHLWSNQLITRISIIKNIFFSFGGGMSISYIFVDLLPKLSKGQSMWQAFSPKLPFLEKHVYFFALIGLLFFYGVERLPIKQKINSFWTSASAYILFNFMVGYAFSNPSDPEIQPIILFTIAIILHQLVKDHLLCNKHRKTFIKLGRFLLAAAIIVGWFIGKIYMIPDIALGLIVSFIGGGMIINVFQYELPTSSKEGKYLPFMIGSMSYAILLLWIG